MPDDLNRTQNELRAAAARRLRDFLREDASGLYQKFWESMVTRWAAKATDADGQNDREIATSLLNDMIEQGMTPPRARNAGPNPTRSPARSRMSPPQRKQIAVPHEPTDGEAEPQSDASDANSWTQDKAGTVAGNADRPIVPAISRDLAASTRPVLPGAGSSAFTPANSIYSTPQSGGGMYDSSPDRSERGPGGIFSPPAPRIGEPTTTMDAEVLAPPQTDEEKARTSAARRSLATIARWLGESTAALTPTAIGSNAALKVFASDVLRICDLLEVIGKGTGTTGASARQAIENARQVSRLFYEGVYERWRGAALAGCFRLGDIGRAADELKQSLCTGSFLAGRVYVEHGAPTYDSYRHELSPNAVRPPERILPMSFGVSAAPPDEQAWRVLVRPFDPNLVQLEAVG